MKIYFISAVILQILVPAFAQSQTQRDNSVTAEEYAVYSALLNEITQSPNDGKPVKLLVVNDRTEGPGKMCLPEVVAKWNKEIQADELKPILSDLLIKNEQRYSLSGQFKLTRHLVLINEETISEIFKKRGYEGWSEFYRKYPNSSGYITFSRVGFNKERTKAFIYRETGCGSLCGYGGYILLNKENGKWKEATGYNCWQS